MTEPISDEALAELRVRQPWVPEAVGIPFRLTERDALLARLDAAERDLLIERTANRVTENHNHFDCAAEMARKQFLLDAALARAVPDGWKVSWLAESPIGPVNVPRLVPADTEEKPK